MKKPQRDYVTSLEAAKILGVVVSTVQKWADEGKLEYWRTAGGHRRIPLTALEKFARSSEHQLESPVDTEGFTIYVVEDDPVILELYASAIRSWSLPVRVKSFNNAFDALIEIGVQRPDMLLLDLRMDGVNGFDLVRHLGSLQVLPQMHVIVVTALDDDEIAEGGGLPEQIEVYAKPLALDHFRKLLEERLPDA